MYGFDVSLAVSLAVSHLLTSVYEQRYKRGSDVTRDTEKLFSIWFSRAVSPRSTCFSSLGRQSFELGSLYETRTPDTECVRVFRRRLVAGEFRGGAHCDATVYVTEPRTKRCLQPVIYQGPLSTNPFFVPTPQARHAQ